MRIKTIEIENYKSLKKVKLDQLGDLNVLIGMNNAGKTSLFELLNRFFAEIDMTGIPAGIDQYCWYDGDQDRDIRVSVELEFENSEFEHVFPIETQVLLKENGKENLANTITISRKIVKSLGWQPEDLKINDYLVMKKGKLVDPKALPQTAYKLKAVFFSASGSKDNITGERLLLINPAKKAYLMGGPYSDSLVKQGKAEAINVSDKTTDWRKYTQDEGYTLVERDFIESDFNSLQPVSQPILQTLVANLTSKLKGAFKLIPSVRDSWPQNPLIRASHLDTETQTLLRSLGTGDSPKERKRWHEIRKEYKAAFGVDFVLHPNYLASEESDLRIPIQHSGAGNQAFLFLMRHLSERTFVFGVEEPEIHLHPELARQLFNILKKISKENQIFISTHSTIFVDQAELANTWIVKKGGKETTVDRIRNNQDLKKIIMDLGVRPSDIFFSNGIIFVEGPSDKEVYATLSTKIGIDFQKMQIVFIPTYGKNSGKYHLEVWTEAAKTANIPFFMILDKDAEKDTRKMVTSGVLTPNQNLFILKKGSIEEYYPKEKILKAIEDEYNLKLTASEAQIVETRNSDKIAELLRSRGANSTGWKVLIARRVTESIDVEEIDDEIKRILERLRTQLNS